MAQGRGSMLQMQMADVGTQTRQTPPKTRRPQSTRSTQLLYTLRIIISHPKGMVIIQHLGHLGYLQYHDFGNKPMYKVSSFQFKCSRTLLLLLRLRLLLLLVLVLWQFQFQFQFQFHLLVHEGDSGLHPLAGREALFP
jgi:hypothetical protein